MGAGNPHIRVRSADSIVGVSPWTKRIRAEILRVADHSSNVLISGPTGTGKELIARAIHAHGRRAGKPFIPVDCAAIVPSLFPSHMFGHLRGAFTGAQYEAMGCFRAADGGALFLDELGELALDQQANLLRALQERAVVPVGDTRPHPVDVRLIAATNRDLEEMVNSGSFREDLYYRLNVVVLHTQALRERPEDLEVLASHFLTKLASENALPYKRLSNEALQRLRSLDWPGNVRQFQNVLERAVVLTDGDTIGSHAISLILDGGDTRSVRTNDSSPVSAPAPQTAEQLVRDAAKTESANSNEDHWVRLDNLERYHIRQTLQYAYFNQTEAARLLGISRRVLAGKMKNLGLASSRTRRRRQTP